MTDDVVVTIADGVSEILLNRALHKNALTAAMYDAISEAILAGESVAA